MSPVALSDPTPQGQPPLRGPSMAHVSLIQAAALFPPLVAAMVGRGTGAAPVLAVALAVSLGWEMLFATMRGRDLSWHGATTSMIVAVMVPASVPLWQLGLAVSLGLVLGELIFGGRGFSFLNAAVAALAFLVFSFPGTALTGDEPLVAMASLPGAALLLVAGLISWRVILSAAVAFFATAVLMAGPVSWSPVASSVTFGLVFLVCDPLSASVTNPGRWLYGSLVGGLAALFNVFGGSGVAPSALVFAALFGSILAPLLDHLVVLAKANRWSTRHG